MQTNLFESQAEFESASAGKTQNELLRDYFMAHPDQWLAMPLLAKIISRTGVGTAVHSRVQNCRDHYSMTILNRVRRPAGQTKSWYRYVTAPTAQS